jgi:acylphosphatase
VFCERGEEEARRLNDSMKRLHAVVRGRVQGVCFRMFTQEQAVQLGLQGWVRNVPGATVEIVAEGSQTRLDEFVERLRSGPELAVVEQLHSETLEAKGGLQELRDSIWWLDGVTFCDATL